MTKIKQKQPKYATNTQYYRHGSLMLVCDNNIDDIAPAFVQCEYDGSKRLYFFLFFVYLLLFKVPR